MQHEFDACPYIGGDFDCFINELTSLEGAPQKVGRNFNCSSNKNLKSLKGVPEIIGKDFECEYNENAKLDYIPKSVGGHFLCRDCTKILKVVNKRTFNRDWIKGWVLRDSDEEITARQLGVL